MSKIKVGFIGLNPDSHWASTAHIPALESLSDDFEVTGVANSTFESAQRTTKALHLKHAFATPQELVSSDEIDLVVVTVKVPYHFGLVSAALNAGKHVHCEWPLGNGLEEAYKLTALAREKGVVATVGTQMRAAVEVKYLQQLIADGYVGEVLSTTLVADAGGWGPETVADLAYLNNKSKGATMLTIPFGHTLASLQDVLGGFASISGRMVRRRDTVHVTDTDATIPSTTEDQIMVNGVLRSGAASTSSRSSTSSRPSSSAMSPPQFTLPRPARAPPSISATGFPMRVAAAALASMTRPSGLVVRSPRGRHVTTSEAKACVSFRRRRER